MHSDLESLINLQRIDARINEYERDREGFPAAISALKNTINKAQEAVDGLTHKMEAILHEKSSLESAVADAKTHLDKSQDLLNAIKTNREYDAVHTQIENFKSVVSSGDAKMKKIDVELTEVQKSIEKSRAELEKTALDNESQIAEIQKKIDTINSSIEQMTAQRNEVVKTVPKSLLRTYMYILKRRKNGQVLSFINADDRTCSVCFKILEPQLVKEIRKADKVIVCQNCGSIFVWKAAEALET